METTANVRVPKELIEKLRQEKALTIEGRCIDTKFSAISDKDARVRREIAVLYFMALCKPFKIRDPRSWPVRFGIIRIPGTMEDIGITLSDLVSNATSHPVPLPRVIIKGLDKAKSTISVPPSAEYLYALVALNYETPLCQFFRSQNMV